MSQILLSKPDRSLCAHIALDGSKSISNRALIALSLAGADPTAWLSSLSTSKDTTTLLRLLTQSAEQPYDAGDAGTTFRFLTAYLACSPGIQTLTGSARMRERPIGPLVYALLELGADIQFLEKEGYPPLRIGEMKAAATGRATVRVAADTSSQFLSALLLVGPYLPGGLDLVPEGNLVSRPYLEMTLRLMRHFGAAADWQEGRIAVEPGGYVPRPLRVEADWSAASYWYAMAAFSDDLDLRLSGLFAQSWQGDAVLADMMRRGFGIETEFEEAGIRLTRAEAQVKPVFEQDFLECPDIAQTLAVVCAGLNTRGLFSGLETLSIKETDRIAALKAELGKLGLSFAKLPAHFSKKTPSKVFYALEGPTVWPDLPPRFATYGDHRMAMAFAPLAFFQPVEIEHPEVVAKSYPGFWDDLQQAGFVARTSDLSIL